MKPADRRQQGLAALELIEQAIHQLRAAPPATLASYYVGALPFVLSVLFFWADMSRSAFADQHLAGAALGVAALFLWMKFWQAVFVRNLRASFAGEPPPPLGVRQAWRIFVAQTTLQPSGLFIVPLACVLILPAAWVSAFYQNLTAFAAAETGDLRPLLKKAARQAALWPRQNHILLAVLLAFGFYVLLNWMTVCLVLPALAKMLSGASSVFTRSPLSLLNTTFLAAMVGLTYLSVDPIVKTVYALRCFYGESLESGEDLKVELRRLALAERLAGGALVLALMIFSTTSASGESSARSNLSMANVLKTNQAPRSESSARSAMFIANVPERHQAPLGAACLTPAIPPSYLPLLTALADTTAGRTFDKQVTPNEAAEAPGQKAADPPPTAPRPPTLAPPTSVSPQALDHTIEQVIQQNKYAWRMPREKLRESETKEPGLIGRFLLRVRDFLQAKIKAFFKWLGEWLRRLFHHRRQVNASGYGWIMLLEVLLYALLAAVVIGLALLVRHVLRNRKLKRKAVASQPIQPAPDLADESLSAEQLPEDRWTALARELLERGELRLAARAFFFASLASLADRNLISLARFKSNRDYEHELQRRGHSFPEILALFSENVRVIDRIWYGLHQINTELVGRFAANVERIKTAA